MIRYTDLGDLQVTACCRLLNARAEAKRWDDYPPKGVSERMQAEAAAGELEQAQRHLLMVGLQPDQLADDGSIVEQVQRHTAPMTQAESQAVIDRLCESPNHSQDLVEEILRNRPERSVRAATPAPVDEPFDAQRLASLTQLMKNATKNRNNSLRVELALREAYKRGKEDAVKPANHKVMLHRAEFGRMRDHGGVMK